MVFACGVLASPTLQAEQGFELGGVELVHGLCDRVGSAMLYAIARVNVGSVTKVWIICRADAGV